MVHFIYQEIIIFTNKNEQLSNIIKNIVSANSPPKNKRVVIRPIISTKFSVDPLILKYPATIIPTNNAEMAHSSIILPFPNLLPPH